MQILNDRQITQKIKRIAIEVLENNFEEEEIILAGINNAGTNFAKLLAKRLRKISKLEVRLTTIRLSPADPLTSDVEIGLSSEILKNKVIIIVDDVANTGRTLFYACKPIFQALPKKLEVAVLVDRTHKSFPIRADYVGLSLATTLLENIEVKIEKASEFAVYLN